MIEKSVPAVKINQDCCSRCSICYSVCPYEAIKRDEETGKFEIDMQKCQVCGICYSACPAMAISILYYDFDGLLKYVEDARKASESDLLILMCRGNSPSTCGIQEILKKQGLSNLNYVALRLPCAGRVPTEFVFKVLKSGIRRVVSIQCEDAFCRFKQGTKIGSRRMALGKAVLKEFGLSKDTLRVVKYSRKIVYDTSKCVGCDKCEFICPYGAIEAEKFATPKVDLDACMGCGACALVCPHNAIQIEGFEFDEVLKKYGEAAKKLKNHGKSPAVLALVCQWSEFSLLDDPENVVFRRKGIVVLEIPCFKSLDPVHVVNALHNGFDGVIAAVCSPEDCKLDKGQETAERNLAVLKDVLKKMNLLDRFEQINLSPRNVGEFNVKLDEFLAKIASLPRSQLEAAQTCTKS